MREAERTDQRNNGCVERDGSQLSHSAGALPSGERIRCPMWLPLADLVAVRGHLREDEQERVSAGVEDDLVV